MKNSAHAMLLRGHVTHQLPASTVARTYSMGFHVTDDALDRLMVIPGPGVLRAPLYPQLMQLPLYSHLLSVLGLKAAFSSYTQEFMLSVAKLAARQSICIKLPRTGPDRT